MPSYDYMIKYVVLGRIFNFCHFLPFGSNKALYGYKIYGFWLMCYRSQDKYVDDHWQLLHNRASC